MIYHRGLRSSAEGEGAEFRDCVALPPTLALESKGMAIPLEKVTLPKIRTVNEEDEDEFNESLPRS